MENITKNIKNKQKPNNHKTLSYQQIRAQTEKQLAQEEELLNQDKIKLGYSELSWDKLLTLSIDNLGQAEASKVLILQQSYRTFMEQKMSYKKTIYLEPSKLHEIVDEAALLLNNDLDPIYQQSGQLVRIISSYSENKKGSGILIKAVDQAFLTVYLTKHGKFMKLDGRRGVVNKVDAPEKLAKYLLAKREWNVSILNGVINAPTLRSDGSVLKDPGYDVLSGLFLFDENHTFKGCTVGETFEDALHAKDQLLHVLKDFPFEDEVSKSVALAAILTALVRKSITSAPLFGFTAPKMASGKSLLADIVSLIATGKSNSVIAQLQKEDEEKKRILAILMEGDQVISYDNVEKPFGNAALCSILTQTEYKDRILGASETRTVSTNATFLATGNNLVFRGDISTRALLCKLDPKVERPEERSFDLNLYEHIPKNRERLVSAGLTILRAYHVADRPKQDIQPFARFEKWSNLIRSAIVWLGMADPCESRKDIERSDPIREMLIPFLACWYEIFSDKPMKLKQLINEIKSYCVNEPQQERYEAFQETLRELSGDCKKSNNIINTRSLAKGLARYKGRIEGGMHLEQAGTNQGITLWCVKKI